MVENLFCSLALPATASGWRYPEPVGCVLSRPGSRKVRDIFSLCLVYFGVLLVPLDVSGWWALGEVSKGARTENCNCPEALSGPCRKRRGLQIV